MVRDLTNFRQDDFISVLEEFLSEFISNLATEENTVLLIIFKVLFNFSSKSSGMSEINIFSIN